MVITALIFYFLVGFINYGVWLAVSPDKFYDKTPKWTMFKQVVLWPLGMVS